MGPSFNEKFDQYGVWRRDFAELLHQLADWLEKNDLIDVTIRDKTKRLELQVRSDRVMVAFVAEFSRGKSELINAIFFANYGRRIMPASAGRTTMCPTELGYEPQVPPSLRLLPIDTRLSPIGLQEWRSQESAWLTLALDIHDADQIAKAVERVAETKRVSIDAAKALGFWHDDLPEDNPAVDAAGLVEIPMWRHALINVPHPLLKQGLVILDTPGLNAVGAEPELTVNLIPQAHAVVFILGADTGVTKSDLAIWREHLAIAQEGADSRLVVLNKVDTLWDTLTSHDQMQAQILRQRANSSELLGLPIEKIVPVSAQKGLVAKITRDDVLLEASGLPHLEQTLSEEIMGRRKDILRSVVIAGITELRADVTRLMHIRRRDLDDQAAELRSLRGKNAAVIQAMRSRIEQEQKDFDAGGAKILAVRSVHLKLLKTIFEMLGSTALKAELLQLSQVLQQRGLKLGAKKIYADTFARLRTVLERAQTGGVEIQNMLDATFRQLNAEFGFSLQVSAAPKVDQYLDDLIAIEQSHIRYLSVGNTLKLVQSEFSERLVRALGMRLRAIYESVANELEMWSRSTTSQLDIQLRERRKSFSRRIDAVDRIQYAAGGLIERLTEIENAENDLQIKESQLLVLTTQLINLPVTDDYLA